jgi:acetyl-CoA carboxylase carboxyltransferase component
MSAVERLKALFDEGSFSELFAGKNSSVVVGTGLVLGKTVYAFSQDRAFENGAVGKGYYEKVKGLYDLAYKTGNPVVGIYDSFGAKLTEAPEALKALSEVNKRAATLSGVVPQIAVVLGTCAGAFATSAASSDLVIASEDAEIFMNSAFFGEEAKEELSDVVPVKTKTEADAIEEARSIIDKLPSNNLSETALYEFVNKVTVEEKTACGYAAFLADEGSETPLYEDAGAYASLSTIGGNVVLLVATPKVMTDAAANKMTKLIKLADAYSVPVVSVVDTEGIEPSKTSTASYSALFKAIAEATTAKVNVITGSAFGAFLAGYVMSGADFTIATDSAVISPIKPSAAAYALKADEMEGKTEKEALDKITAEYIAENCTAEKAAQNGIATDVSTDAELKGKVIAALNILSTKKESTLPKKHSI